MYNVLVHTVIDTNLVYVKKAHFVMIAMDTHKNARHVVPSHRRINSSRRETALERAGF